MAAKKVAKKSLTANEKVGLGIGLTAAAVAAAGAYFLYGSKKAPQNRKKVKGWTLKAKGEVLEALEKAEKISQDEYGELVASATKAYGTVERATKGEIKDFQSEMIEHWNDLQKNKAVKKIVGVVTKNPASKTPTKKVISKASPKVAPKAVSKVAKKTTKKVADAPVKK